MMTNDPQVLDGTITITENATARPLSATFRPLSATELLEDPPLTPADWWGIAAMAILLIVTFVGIIFGGWLLAPDGWLP